MSKVRATTRKKWNFRPRLEELEARTLLDARYWDGGGLDNLASNAENWSDDTLPTAADTAIFDATSTKSAEVDSAFTDTIAYLQVNSGYTGTLTVNRDLTVTSTLNHDAGAIVVQAELEVGDGWVSQTMTLNATGRLIANGDFQLTASGELAGPGAVEVRGGVFDVDGDFDVGETTIGGGTIRFNAPSPVAATLNLHGGALGGAATITVSATMLWTGGSMIDSGVTEVAAAAELIISSDDDRSMTDTRVLRNLGQAEWTDGGHIGGLGEPVIENAGDFEALGWGRLNAVRFDNSAAFTKSAETTLIIEGVFDNTGTVAVLGGSLDLWGGGTSSGAFTVSADATLTLGTYLIDEEGGVTGPGTVWFVGSTTIDGTYDVGVTRVGGSPEFNAAAFTGQLLLESGEISGTESLTVADFFYWAGGNIGADVSVANSDRMIIASGDHGLSGTLVNNGTVEWISRGSVGGAGTIDNNGDFRIAQDVNLGSVGFTFNNYGNLIVQTQGIATLNGNFFNYSDVVVKSGNLSIMWGESSGSFSLDARDAAVSFVGSGYVWDTGTTFSGLGQVVVAAGVDIEGTVSAAILVLRGTLGGAGDLSISEKLIWSSGNMQGDGTVTIGANATLYLTGPDLGLDRIVHNYGWLARTNNVRVGRGNHAFEHPYFFPDFGAASSSAWSTYTGAVTAADNAFALEEGSANTIYTNNEATLAASYELAHEAAFDDYQDALADAEDDWNASAQDAAAEEDYWNAIADAEQDMDDDVAAAAETYVTDENSQFEDYWNGLYDEVNSSSKINVLRNAVTAARNDYQDAIDAARVAGRGNVLTLAGDLRVALFVNNPPSMSGVWDVLEFTSADTRAAIARAYYSLYESELFADITEKLQPILSTADWEDTTDLYFYGTTAGSGTQPTPPSSGDFLSGVDGFISSAFTTIWDMSSNLIEGVQDAWDTVVAAGGAVVTETTGFVRDVAYLLENDPAALTTAVGQGVRDGVAIVANTATFGIDQELNDHVMQLVQTNGGLYYIAQLSAGVARECVVSTLTMGVTSLASTGTTLVISGAQNMATRMGVSLATQARILCPFTTGARLYQPYSTYQQFNTTISNASQAYEAIERGDYATAGALFAQAGISAAPLYGSLRENMRMASAFAAGPQGIRDYLSACFAAGTPILWEHGEKRVEEFRPGDRVWARNEDDPNGPLELKPIEECFDTMAPIWHLHVGGRVILTTAEHPFWVKGKGWTATQNLEIGDVLIGHDGLETVVEDLFDTDTWGSVYNFRVADYHTYYVGSKTWGFSVWAHNACFANRRLLSRHHNEHGSDFSAANPMIYERLASRFLFGAPSHGVLQRIRGSGDIVRYNPATEEFGILSANGVIRTYYKPNPAFHGYPTNLDYFNAQ